MSDAIKSIADHLSCLAAWLSTLRPTAREHGNRVLLAEDNSVNRMVARGLLDAAGFAYDEAVNGAEAIAMASSKRYRMVLMDVQMPVVDGLAATRRIRDNPDLRDLPILAMSASVLPHERQQCLEAGMNDFIAKPISAEQFYEAIQRWTSGAASSPERTERGPQDVQLPAAIAGIDMATGLRSMADIQELYVDTLRAFVEKGANRIERLRSAAGSGDLIAAAREAHSLKGMAAQIGATEIPDLAQSLEDAFHRGDCRAGLGLINDIEAKLAALRNAVHLAFNGAASE